MHVIWKYKFIMNFLHVLVLMHVNFKLQMVKFYEKRGFFFWIFSSSLRILDVSSASARALVTSADRWRWTAGVS